MDNNLRKAIVRLGYDALLLRLALKQADLTGCTTEDAVLAAFVLNEAAATICQTIQTITAATTCSDRVLLAELERNVVPFKKPKTGNP